MYGLEIERILLYNLILVPVVTFLLYILFRRIGTLVTSNLNQLIQGIQYVKEGNLDHNISINTHDEIQLLAESYNFMRKGLKEMNRLKD